MGIWARITRSEPPVAGARLPDLPGLDLGGNILDKLVATAHVGLAYGAPTTVEGRTFIPIGSVAYGVGGGRGFGKGPVTEGAPESIGGGGGGGGGVRVTPVAFLEITRNGTKIRPVVDWTRIGIALITVLIPVIGVGGFKRFIRRTKIGTSP